MLLYKKIVAHDFRYDPRSYAWRSFICSAYSRNIMSVGRISSSNLCDISSKSYTFKSLFLVSDFGRAKIKTNLNDKQRLRKIEVTLQACDELYCKRQIQS